MLAALLALTAAAAQPAPAEESTLPHRTTVLAAPGPGYQLPVCSRGTAGPVEGGWEPKDAQVAAMDDALAAVLPTLADRDGYTRGTENPDPLTFRAGDRRWQREVFGIIRDGRRLIYGNYLPADIAPDQRHLPTVVCDGGATFFGVEYDPATGTITHIAFNGGLGAPLWPVYMP